MSVFKDQLQREVVLNDVPLRIVSLVPSITELLFDLGLENEVVGITKFCVHPETWFRTKTRVGGTKNIKVDVVAALQPQLIIANKEENVREQIGQLENISPVWVTDVSTLEDALNMIKEIGMMTNRKEQADIIAKKIECGFENLRSSARGVRACYLIWNDPYMSIGSDTFIHDMLRRCGFENIFADCTRYPEVSVDQIKSAGCKIVFLSSEPFPFKQKHVETLQTQLPDCNILLVDGEMFSWYGSRLISAAGYFQHLVNKIGSRNKKL